MDPMKKLMDVEEDEVTNNRILEEEVNDMSFFLSVMNETGHILAFTSVD